MDNEINFSTVALGVAISVVGFVSTTATAVLAYFLKKRDATIDMHTDSIQKHADRLTHIEASVDGLKEDVVEIKADVKGVAADTGAILRQLLDQRNK